MAGKKAQTMTVDFARGGNLVVKGRPVMADGSKGDLAVLIDVAGPVPFDVNISEAFADVYFDKKVGKVTDLDGAVIKFAGKVGACIRGQFHDAESIRGDLRRMAEEGVKVSRDDVLQAFATGGVERVMELKDVLKLPLDEQLAILNNPKITKV